MKFGIAAKRLALALMGGLVLAAAPAQAQFYSDGYKFLEAVKKRNVDEVIEFVNEPGSTLLNSRDLTTGETALHIVTEQRDLVWLTFFLERGANPNISDVQGVTPLVLAARLGWIEGVQALVDNKARVDEASRTGETPLIAAVHRRDIEMMRALLKAGADPDRADNSGRTARDYAQLDTAKGSLMIAEIEKSEAAKGGKAGGSYGPSF